MFSHIMVGADDIEQSKNSMIVYSRFGGRAWSAFCKSHWHKRYMYFLDGNVFLISEPIDDEPATHGNGSTVGFAY